MFVHSRDTLSHPEPKVQVCTVARDLHRSQHSACLQLEERTRLERCKRTVNISHVNYGLLASIAFPFAFSPRGAAATYIDVAADTFLAQVDFDEL